MHTLTFRICPHAQTEREREGGAVARFNANSIFLKTPLNFDEPEDLSGLLAPRANNKASVQWANKYSMLLMRQP